MHTRSALALPPDEYQRLRDEIGSAYGLAEISPDVRAFVQEAARELVEDRDRFERKEAANAAQA